MYKDLNVSTLVMMLDTNIIMNPRKLDEIFELLKPIDYDENREGIVKISVRGNHNGQCKKMIYQKNKKTSVKTDKKTFQNQLSFYIRVFDDQDVTQIGEFGYDDEKQMHFWEYKKGQTAFQCNGIKCTSENDNNTYSVISSINRKSIKDKNILTNKNVNNEKETFEDICYANTLKVFSNEPLSNIVISFVIEVNMFVFTSGKIKVAGCTSDLQVTKSMKHLMNCFGKYINNSEIDDYIGINHNHFNINSRNPVMINSDFKNSFEVKRYELDCLIRESYGLISTYEPCTHPAVIVKYYCNDSHDDITGKCLCRKLYNKEHFCKGRGDATKDGGCKSVTILVFQSGKVIITGGRVIEQVHKAYNFIKKVLHENKEFIEREEIRE